MNQRIIYLEGHVRKTLPVLIEVPEDFKDDEELLSLSSSIMAELGEEIPFDFWQPFNNKIAISQENKEQKPALLITRLKEEECKGHIKFKVEKVKHEQ